MKDNTTRNIRAIAVLDFVIGIISIATITVYFLCQIGIIPHWCPDNFNLSLKLWVAFLGGILFLISGSGLWKRKEWARKVHYILPLLVVFGKGFFGIAYAVVVWTIITKDKFKEAFQIK